MVVVLLLGLTEMLPSLVALLLYVMFKVAVVNPYCQFDKFYKVIWLFYTRDFVLHRVLESLIVLRFYGLIVLAYLSRVLLEFCRVIYCGSFLL